MYPPATSGRQVDIATAVDEMKQRDVLTSSDSDFESDGAMHAGTLGGRHPLEALRCSYQQTGKIPG